ncbi:MAG: peptidase E [Pseudomonadota bacterium]
MSDKRQIFAIGGRFYVDPWEAPLLQRHWLSLMESACPKICYLGTATGDRPDLIEEFYRTMAAHRVSAAHLNLFKPHTADFEDYFSRFDGIYVGGGATRNMIALWKDWGIGAALKTAWENGVLLSGTSAGAICWFDDCITDSLPQTMLPLDCLGFVPGACNTHYSARPDRRPTFQHHIAAGRLTSPGLAIDDNVGVHVVGQDVREIVTQKEGCTAYWVTRNNDGSVTEQAAQARLLS